MPDLDFDDIKRRLRDPETAYVTAPAAIAAIEALQVELEESSRVQLRVGNEAAKQALEKREALDMIEQLLNTCELNLDEIEESTIETIDAANELLAKHGRVDNA